MISVRLDHLEAVVNYALEQANDTVEVLSFGDNENDVHGQDAINSLENMLTEIKSFKACHAAYNGIQRSIVDSGNCEVTLVESNLYYVMSDFYYDV